MLNFQVNLYLRVKLLNTYLLVTILIPDEYLGSPLLSITV